MAEEESEFLAAYASIKTAYKAAMTQVDLAVCHEEQESLGQAIEAYALALRMIEDTFGIPVGLPKEIDTVQTEWNDACALIQKLKSAETELRYRLKILRSQNQSIDDTAMEAKEESRTTVDTSRPLLAENPYTHYDIANSSGTPKTYRELAAGLRELLAVQDSNVLLDELFRAQVKIYRIEASGTVTSMSCSSTMSLVMCTVGGKWKYLSGMYYIQCSVPNEGAAGIWLYPLVPSITHCYQTEYGAFIFSDMECQQPGNAFGLILTKEGLTSNSEMELEDLQQFFLDLLEAVLAGTVEQLKSPTSQRAGLASDTVSGSEQVSRHIVSAADFIASNLVKGAEKTGGLMLRSTPYLISKMTPASVDTQVPSSVQTSGVKCANMKIIFFI
ncbi:protein spartin isoform X3 [Drosophila erecta]|uniref:protein spartin isoform X3 n=1 Tax=Drosophila erecta TaxID=7220 RepID=UPI000F047750|nr:protein spartin isoform X3 [Drosophila erecta]